MLGELAPQSPEGDYVRPAAQLGSTSPDGGWAPEWPIARERYHLYIGNACPWCHRVLATLSVLGLLDGAVTFSRMVDDPSKASRGGWCFDDASELSRDPVFGAFDLREVYNRCSPGGSYTGRCTAPLMIDKERGAIVSNESGDIVRMLNFIAPALRRGAGGEPGGGSGREGVDLFPEALRADIIEANRWIYEDVNNGVYKCGFCTTQEAYCRAESALHKALKRLDAHFAAGNEFVCGAQLTEADIRLLPTISRFDGVYANIFRCGRLLIRADYPAINDWLLRMLAVVGDGQGPLYHTVDLDAARHSYYTNLFPLNPGGLVPLGPTATELGWQVTHSSLDALIARNSDVNSEEPIASR